MPLHLLINALSASAGGSQTVVREIARHLRLVAPHMRVSMLLTEARDDHAELARCVAGAGVNILHAPPHTRRRIARMFWETTKLPGLVRRERVSVVMQPNGMIPRALRVPVFAHIGDPWPYIPVRDLWYDPILASLRRRGHATAVRRAQAMGFTSRFMMQLVRDHFGTLPARSEVYYNGIPRAWIDRPSHLRPALESREPHLLSVSNVSLYKRQELVIRALPLLRRDRGLEHLTYRIIGSCDRAYQSRLEALASTLGVRDAVRFEGRVSDDAVRDAYATARCFVLPSLCESFGIPAIEAMSFGLPVVVARATAVPEICADAAEYAEPDDLDSLCGALRRVLLDDAHARELVLRGLDNIRRFDWSAAALGMARTLESLASETPRGENPES